MCISESYWMVFFSGVFLPAKDWLNKTQRRKLKTVPVMRNIRFLLPRSKSFSWFVPDWGRLLPGNRFLTLVTSSRARWSPDRSRLRTRSKLWGLDRRVGWRNTENRVGNLRETEQLRIQSEKNIVTNLKIFTEIKFLMWHADMKLVYFEMFITIMAYTVLAC